MDNPHLKKSLHFTQTNNPIIIKLLSTRRMKQVRRMPSSPIKMLFPAKCLRWKDAARMVEDMKEFQVLNKTCFKSMEDAAKSTAKGLKGRCLRKFVGETRIVSKLFVAPTPSKHPHSIGSIVGRGDVT
jgi:hypothetical protein